MVAFDKLPQLPSINQKPLFFGQPFGFSNSCLSKAALTFFLVKSALGSEIWRDQIPEINSYCFYNISIKNDLLGIEEASFRFVRFGLKLTILP